MKKEQLTIRLSEDVKKTMDIMYGNEKAKNIERLVMEEAEKSYKYAIVLNGEEIGDEYSRNETEDETLEEIKGYYEEDLINNNDTEYKVYKYLNDEVVDSWETLDIKREVENMIKNKIEVITQEVKSLILECEEFVGFSKSYEMENEEQALNLEAELDNLEERDMQVTQLGSIVVVHYENLDKIGRMMKKHDKDFSSRAIEEKRALSLFLPNCESDIKSYFEQGLNTYTFADWNANAEEENKEMLEDGFDKEDLIKKAEELEEGLDGDTFKDSENKIIIEIIRGF